MEWKDNYNYWINNAPKNVVEEIEKYTDEEKQLYFQKNLEFGTAGLRGKIGYGSNLINEYNIAKYSLAYGKTLIEKYGTSAFNEGVVIAHDNRKGNILFSTTAAKVLSSLGIPVFFFKDNELNPTPLLSFTIAKGNYVGGINITASHNPPEDNGFKIYNHTGTQMLPNETDRIVFFSQIDNDIFNIPQSETNIHYLTDGIINQYIDTILKMILFDDKNVDRKDLRITYTSQHGTATKIADKILKQLNVTYEFVKEQSYPDENFTNTESANPQDPRSFNLAREYGDRNNSDLLFCTDPDADRFGLEVKHDGKWVHINGNELPLIQLFYKLTRLKEINYINSGDFIVRSVVTSKASDAIAEMFDVDVYESLTGFKWIIAEAFKHEMQGNECLFAWEESYGSTVRTFTRDKDSFQALTQVIEMSDIYKKQGKTLVDVLNEIYGLIGYYRMSQIPLRISGLDGMNKMNQIIDTFRKMKVGDEIEGLKIIEVRDFMEGYKNFRKENILFLMLENNSFVAIRPSGTEPILRIYFDVKASNMNKAIDTENKLQNYFKEKIN